MSNKPVSFFELMSSRDLEGLASHLAEEAVFRFPKTQDLVGREKVLKFLRLLFRRYPELTFEVKGIVSEGDRTVVHWTNRGRARKGGEYSNEGLTWMEWRGGELIFISDFFKDTEAF